MACDAVWKDITDVNTHFWGIECENLGTAADPYPARQIDAVVWRCRERRRVLKINDPDMLTRHRDVCVPPGRKNDTSDSFPWEEVPRGVFAPTDPTDTAAPTSAGRPELGQFEKYNVLGLGPGYGVVALAFAGALRAASIGTMAIHNGVLDGLAARPASAEVHRRGPRIVAIGPHSAAPSPPPGRP